MRSHFIWQTLKRCPQKQMLKHIKPRPAAHNPLYEFMNISFWYDTIRLE